MRQKSERLGGGVVVPERVYAGPPPESYRSLADREPETKNPGVDELSFDIAAEGRDVADRLRDLQVASGIADDPEAGGELEGEVMDLNLDGALRQAQRTGREFLNAEEEYILQAIGLLLERHQWEPRFFNETSAALTGGQVDGDSSNALSIVNQLGVRQRLPYGGEATARWLFNATENLRSSATGQYRQSSQLVLDASIPLLRGAGLLAQESLIQAERNLVYSARSFESFRRDYLVSVARDYFSLLQQHESLENQATQLKSLRWIEDRQRSWYEAGLVPEFQVNLAANDVLNAEAGLANSRESLILALDRFKVRLGLPTETRLRVAKSDLTIPEPDVTLDEAAQLALLYRLDLQNERDRLEDTRRAVKIAQNQLLPDLDLSGGVSLPTDADEREGGAVFEPDDAQYNAAITFGLPLDRVNERLGLRQATIRLQQAQREFERFRDNLVLEVRARVREIERARFNLRLAEERVMINQRRKEEQEIKADEVTAQELVDTAEALLQAEQARDQARTDLRNSVLDYLLATGQLRVKRDGTFEPLPGMGAAESTTDAPAPQFEPEPMGED